jgi:cysteine synthase A
MTKLVNCATKMIGDTPIVKLNKIVPEGFADIYAKTEFMNAGGSVKDRIALNMIETAEKEGKLKPGMTIVEPTSGNTGVGLAMVGAIKGYDVTLAMPETMSYERRVLLKMLGATLILTRAEEGMAGSVTKATEIAEDTTKYFMPQQFSNPANPEIHRITTAVEILKTLKAEDIGAFVAGVGTGGTLTGVGEVLKQNNKNIKIYAVEPAKSAVLSKGSPGPHQIQGIGAGFIPEVLNQSIIDKVITVTDTDAFKTQQKLAKKDGLITGISSGAAVWASLQVAEDLNKDKIVVTILPDTGDRYLSLMSYFSKEEEI